MKKDRFENTYYDKTGRQILVGDLLRIDHFMNGKTMHYMYHVVVMERTKDGEFMAQRAYYAEKPHARMFILSDEVGFLGDTKIIGTLDFQTKRRHIKV